MSGLIKSIRQFFNMLAIGIGFSSSEMATENIAGTDTDKLLGIANNRDNDLRMMIRAGKTTQKRAYFDWRNALNQNVWLFGVNAGNEIINYDTGAAAHRINFLPGSHAYVSAAGSGAVILNGHPDNASGTGGLLIRSGGASPVTWHQFLSSGGFIRGPLQINESDNTTELHLLAAAGGTNRISGSSGGIHTILRNNRTANTNQTIRLAARAYAAEGGTPSAILIATTTSTANEVAIGGGSGAMNAATKLAFYAAPNAASGAGVEVMRVVNQGLIVEPEGVSAGLNAAVALEVRSTSKGLLFPRLTTAQRDAIGGPPAGLVIYNTTTNKLNVRTATAWEAVTSA